MTLGELRTAFNHPELQDVDLEILRVLYQQKLKGPGTTEPDLIISLLIDKGFRSEQIQLALRYLEQFRIIYGNRSSSTGTPAHLELPPRTFYILAKFWQTGMEDAHYMVAKGILVDRECDLKVIAAKAQLPLPIVQVVASMMSDAGDLKLLGDVVTFSSVELRKHLKGS